MGKYGLILRIELQTGLAILAHLQDDSLLNMKMDMWSKLSCSQQLGPVRHGLHLCGAIPFALSIMTSILNALCQSRAASMARLCTGLVPALSISDLIFKNL